MICRYIFSTQYLSNIFGTNNRSITLPFGLHFPERRPSISRLSNSKHSTVDTYEHCIGTNKNSKIIYVIIYKPSYKEQHENMIILKSLTFKCNST